MNHATHHLTRRLARALLAGLFLLMLPACARFTGGAGLAPTAEPSSTRSPVIVEATDMAFVPTETEPPTPTPAITATPSATPTPFLTPETPATVTAANVRLRAGPGLLFKMLDVLAKESPITVLGRAPGDDWVYVRSDRGQGWLSIDFTSLSGSGQLASMPVHDTGDAVVVKGQVAYSAGGPFPGVEFSIYRDKKYSDKAETPPDGRAHSQADGSFYLYLPPGSNGVWRISLTAVDCKSPIMDANCRYTGAFVPRLRDVTLPSNEIVEFRYFK